MKSKNKAEESIGEKREEIRKSEERHIEKGSRGGQKDPEDRPRKQADEYDK
jgi:hypothetical protein